MSSDDVEKELLQLEQRFWQAIKDGDGRAAAALTDETCVMAGAQGVSRINRDQLVAMLQKAPYRLDRFELGRGASVARLGDDVAVVAYQVHEELTVDGEPVKLDAADTSTWVRRDGRWLCAAHTEALAGDPYGRDRRPSFAAKTVQ